MFVSDGWPDIVQNHIPQMRRVSIIFDAGMGASFFVSDPILRSPHCMEADLIELEQSFQEWWYQCISYKEISGHASRPTHAEVEIWQEKRKKILRVSTVEHNMPRENASITAISNESDYHGWEFMQPSDWLHEILLWFDHGTGGIKARWKENAQSSGTHTCLSFDFRDWLTCSQRRHIMNVAWLRASHMQWAAAASVWPASSLHMKMQTRGNSWL